MKHEEEATQLRSDLETRRDEGTTRGRGYPVEVRRRVVAYMTDCRKRRETVETVAARLGMSSSTLSMWMKQAKDSSVENEVPVDATFAPVQIVKASRVVMTSPSGWRAEIDLPTFIALVAGRR